MRRGLLPVLVALAGCVVVSGCGAPPVSRFVDPLDPVRRAYANLDPAALAASLPDEDLVGQLLVPRAAGMDATQVSAAAVAQNRKLAGVDTPAQMIAKYHLGGLILSGATGNGTGNLDTPDQVHQLTTGLQAAAAPLPARQPVLLGTDQEYGTVTRIRSGVTALPSGLGVGAAGDVDLTTRAWAAAGADLASLGINLDFGPDADVLGPAGGGIIGSRSFGSDAATVSAQVAAAVRGLHQAGVAATLKHFPGHGHTDVDSHQSLPVLAQSAAQLQSGDLPPFAAGIAAGADLVMSGHLDVRAVDPGTPASFSAKLLVDVLRTQLGFTGVVVTDALDMAPAQRWSPGEAAVRAFLAGNDLLLQPPNLTQAQAGLLAAVRSGRIPRARLVQSVTRILALKRRLAIGPVPGPMAQVGNADRQAAASRLSAAAVTLLRGACHGPLVTGPVRVTAPAGDAQQRAWLTGALGAAGLTVTTAGGTEIRLVGYGDTSAALSPTAGVTVAMDLPTVLSRAASPVRLATYSGTQSSMTALAAVLAGTAGAPGRSPVEVAGLPRSACRA